MSTIPQSVHPLTLKAIAPIYDWSEWRAKWEQETSLEILEGLLFGGFDVRLGNDTDADRVVFYLRLADGYSSPEPFRVSGEKSRHQDKLPEMRQRLARKAFKVLAQHFFKPLLDHPDRQNMVWWRLYDVDERLFDELLWFLRPGQYRRVNNLNDYQDRGGHYLQLARDFALELCEQAWTCKGLSDSRADEERVIEQLKSAQPMLLPALSELDGLMSLMNSRWQPTDECVVALRRMALTVGPGRDYQTVEEALVDGRKAAAVLVLLGTQRQEQQRQAEIGEIEQQARQAEQRLKQLRS